MFYHDNVWSYVGHFDLVNCADVDSAPLDEFENQDAIQSYAESQNVNAYTIVKDHNMIYFKKLGHLNDHNLKPCGHCKSWKMAESNGRI